MIKKLSFKGTKTYGDTQKVMFDKIDEIAEVVNSLTESKKEVMVLKNRIAVLETNNNVDKVACGGRNVDTDGSFNTPTYWEPYREDAMTTITQSKDGVTVTIGKKERGAVVNVPSAQIDGKELANATAQYTSNSKCRGLR